MELAARPADPATPLPPRLPHLRSVIVTDSRHPGMFHVDDVRQAAGSVHTRLLQDLQRKLCVDDPINIQFTSVTTAPLQALSSGLL